MQVTRSRFLVTAITLVLAVAQSHVARAQCELNQVTDLTAGFLNVIDMDDSGRRILVRSTGDLTPGNPGNGDGNLEYFLLDSTTGVTTQITDSTGFNETAGPGRIAAGGSCVAFSSGLDLTPGSPGNADGNREVFLYDIASASFTQITNTTGGFNGPEVRVDGDCTLLAIVSDRDLTPGNPGNADGNLELFLYDVPAVTFTQITDTMAFQGAGIPEINALGTIIAFGAYADLTPGAPGNADHNFEMYIYDIAANTLTQATDTPLGTLNYVGGIDAAGRRIAVNSDADLTPGNPGNADGSDEVFLFDRVLHSFTQITDTLAPKISYAPTISGNGLVLAIISNADLTPGSPGNADGFREYFLFDTATSMFTQLTDTVGDPGISLSIAINYAGTRAVFAAAGDLVPGDPGNSDGSEEIFAARCFLERASILAPALSSGGIALAIALLLLVASLSGRKHPRLFR